MRDLKMKSLVVSALVLCFTLSYSVASAAEVEKLALSEHYQVVGTNANGSKYSGVADIKGISDTTFSIVWHIGSATQSGFGMRMKDTLSATYMLNGEPGLIIYRVQGNGSFTGTWAIRGEKGLGTETLTPRSR